MSRCLHFPPSCYAQSTDHGNDVDDEDEIDEYIEDIPPKMPALQNSYKSPSAAAASSYPSLGPRGDSFLYGSQLLGRQSTELEVAGTAAAIANQNLVLDQILASLARNEALLKTNEERTIMLEKKLSMEGGIVRSPTSPPLGPSVEPMIERGTSSTGRS